MKIGRIGDIVPDLNKVASVSGGLPNMGVFSPAGIKQINLILTNIREMVKEAKGINKPAEKETEPKTDRTLQTSGLTKEQLFGFVKQFLDNLISQGYGDKTPAEVISEIPFSIKQLRGLLK